MEPTDLRIAIVAAALAVAGLVIAGLSATAVGMAKALAKWPVAGRRPKRTVPRGLGVVVGVVMCGVAAGLAGSLIRLPEGVPGFVTVAVAAAIALAATGIGSVKLANKIELSALINSPSPTSGDPQIAIPLSTMQPSVADGSQPETEIAYGEPYPGLVSHPDDRRRDDYQPVVPSPSSSPEIVAGHGPSVGLHTTTPTSESPAIGDPTWTDRTSSTLVKAVDLPDDAVPGWVYADSGDNWYLVISTMDGLGLVRLSDFSAVTADDLTGNLHVGGSIEITVWPVGDAESDPGDEPESEQHERPEP